MQESCVDQDSAPGDTLSTFCKSHSVQELFKSELVFPDKQTIPGHQLLGGVKMGLSPAIYPGGF